MSIENTHYGANKIKELLANKSSVYFIGVGGINMSSLAQITHENGYRTGGSDRVCTALTEKIAASGIKVNYNHMIIKLFGIKGYNMIFATKK